MIKAVYRIAFVMALLMAGIHAADVAGLYEAREVSDLSLVVLYLIAADYLYD